MLKTEVELEMDFLRYCLYTKQRIPSITDWELYTMEPLNFSK